MTHEDIIRGENKNVEFKAALPRDSEKYVKTIVGFANTQGGTLIIGVDDETREIVGVDKDSVFQVMDAIANAVSDSCTPQIVPDITFQTLEGKTIVAAAVEPGANRPYYLRAKGKEHGTYVRVGGTSRPAGAEKIRRAARDHGLAEPEFIETAGTFRINLYRPSKFEGEVRGSSVKFGKHYVNETQEEIIKLIASDEHITAVALAERLSISVRSIEKHVKALREAGILTRHGSARRGYWEISVPPEN